MGEQRVCSAFERRDRHAKQLVPGRAGLNWKADFFWEIMFLDGLVVKFDMKSMLIKCCYGDAANSLNRSPEWGFARKIGRRCLNLLNLLKAASANAD